MCVKCHVFRVLEELQGGSRWKLILEIDNFMRKHRICQAGILSRGLVFHCEFGL